MRSAKVFKVSWEGRCFELMREFIHTEIDLPTSFTLVANYSTSLSPDVDPQTRDALEGYFYDSAPRLFTLSTSAVDGSVARAEHTQAWLHERRKFIEQFGKAKMAQRTQQGKGKWRLIMTMFFAQRLLTETHR